MFARRERGFKKKERSVCKERERGFKKEERSVCKERERGFKKEERNGIVTCARGERVDSKKKKEWYSNVCRVGS